jgi:hypothetical protein
MRLDLRADIGIIGISLLSAHMDIDSSRPTHYQDTQFLLVAGPRNEFQITRDFLEEQATSNLIIMVTALAYLYSRLCTSVALGWQLRLLSIAGSAPVSQTDLVYQAIRCRR